MEGEQELQEPTPQLPELNKEDKPASPFKKPVLIGKIGRLPRKVVIVKNVSEDNKNTVNDIQEIPKEISKDESLRQEVASVSDGKPVKAPAQQLAENSTPLPYKEPSWSGLPRSCSKHYSFEVLKSGVILKEINLMEKPFWVFGRSPNCEIYMTNPTVSRYHAILQYRKEGTEDSPPGFYIYDLNSTHGTFLNKGRLKPRVYAPVKVGHIIKLGFSTCSYILTGPEEDSEEESEFTVTELRQQRAEKLLQQELAEKEARVKAEKEAEEQCKREEERGVDWGLGEDADEETDISENPYAQTTNEELYIDDPKKALRGFMEREGHDLEYDCTEQGFGQFLCKVELPIDDDHGRPIIAEVLHKGKKKEAVIQCALEACRILDRYGLLRKATHESRKRKAKNWEENDYYDSDDDTFLDRTGTIEKKREKRMQSKVPQQPETYQSLLEKEKKVSEKISEIEKQLSKAKAANSNESSSTNEDSLDVYMKELKESKPDKQTISKLKSELVALKVEHINIVKLVNLAKPADLPPIVINSKSVGDQQGSSGVVKGKTLPLFGKRPKIKVQLPVEPSTDKTSENMDVGEEKEEEEEEEEKEKESNDNSLQGQSCNTRQSPENENTSTATNKTVPNVLCRGRVHFKITELERLLVNTKFPSSLEMYVTEIEEILEIVKDLTEHEGRIQSDKKTIMAKNRKVTKHIDNLLENFDQNHVNRICKACRRLYVELQEIAVEQHKLSSKIRMLGMKIDLLCKEIQQKMDEIKDNKQKTPEQRVDSSSTRSYENLSQDDTVQSDEDDDKHLTLEELEKRRKRNQRRLLHRRERAEIEKQKGYQEDARREDYNMWVPPENQTGDGRTNLNEKYGY